MGFNISEITIMNAAKRVQLSKIFRTEAAWREYLLRNAVALSQLVGLRMEPDRPEVPQGNMRFDLRDFRPVWFRAQPDEDRKSTRLNYSHVAISYAVFCLKKDT